MSVVPVLIVLDIGVSFAVGLSWRGVIQETSVVLSFRSAES
jgi:hypothetical protein